MSVWELLAASWPGAVIGLIVGFILMWRQHRTRRVDRIVDDPPAPPTLREVHAADMDHWDKRYQQALMDGLGDECCLCDLRSGKYSCLIHRDPKTHPPLSYIQREAAGYRARKAA